MQDSLDDIGVLDHCCEFLETQFPISVSSAHTSTTKHVADPSLSASMIVLSTICCNCWSYSSALIPIERRSTDLQVVPHHLLQYQIQLSIRDESVSVHVVHLECNLLVSHVLEQAHLHRSFSSLPPLLLKALRPPTNS